VRIASNQSGMMFLRVITPRSNLFVEHELSKSGVHSSASHCKTPGSGSKSERHAQLAQQDERLRRISPTPGHGAYIFAERT
jgi:hypothetical protein